MASFVPPVAIAASKIAEEKCDKPQFQPHAAESFPDDNDPGRDIGNGVDCQHRLHKYLAHIATRRTAPLMVDLDVHEDPHSHEAPASHDKVVEYLHPVRTLTNVKDEVRCKNPNCSHTQLPHDENHSQISPNFCDFECGKDSAKCVDILTNIRRIEEAAQQLEGIHGVTFKLSKAVNFHVHIDSAIRNNNQREALEELGKISSKLMFNGVK